MKKLPSLPDIPDQDQSPVVKSLLALVEQLVEQVQQQTEEIALLKGEKKRPVFKDSKLDKQTGPETPSEQRPKKRAGSTKRKKTRKLVIHKDKVITPSEAIPSGSHFKGYRHFIVQDLNINVQTTRYRLEHWVTPQNKTLMGQLPDALNNRHFGPRLIRYILYQHHHCQTTQPLLLE